MDSGDSTESYAKRQIVHKRQIQYAKKQARENMVANGLLSMGMMDSGGSVGGGGAGGSGGGFDTQMNYRKMMMDRERAMDQAIHTHKSKVGRAILKGNETEQRKLEQRMRQLENAKRLSKMRLDHNKRMTADEYYGILTGNSTKTLYHLKDNLPEDVLGLPSTGMIIEKEVSKSLDPKLRIETPDYLPEVSYYTAYPSEASVFRIHPTRGTLKRVSSVESVVKRDRLRVKEESWLNGLDIKKERRYEKLEDLLGKDQNKYHLQLVKSGVPSFRRGYLGSDLDGGRARTLDVDERKAKEDIAQILEKYPFRKSYIQKQLEQETWF